MHDASDGHDTLHDHAPGGGRHTRGGVRTYLAGLGFAVVLTLASFWVASTQTIWGPSVPVLLAALAIGQMGVHVVFFLHISSGPDDTNNFLALAFGIFIVGLVVFGSMLIMSNLNSNNMTPMANGQMQMQR
ncbi:cytochrome o ubiquinol oxidase operon protein cyoD [Enhydrobacter aerosaccus]|uniref:Cytochrome bo(3) ubiquinol oxidase subunit 4 n=1 Tax=Enhydrobacter aerosaccus TaxID=225324 RepID=A0A1T4RW86_9HYPH|nr:cytochrome o ubiquinol oxidase subunit IV [Enhydrobacter aerosaccus]SKA20205.1 cytochrome o ubiquinol oxidase operon protein cyoD [Enhydrobacter aerosaccus]